METGGWGDRVEMRGDMAALSDWSGLTLWEMITGSVGDLLLASLWEELVTMATGDDGLGDTPTRLSRMTSSSVFVTSSPDVGLGVDVLRSRAGFQSLGAGLGGVSIGIGSVGTRNG